ncbi:MAG: hypothetical protein WBD25_17340 [Terriglobales bacterium]|jgi:hypothetical protein
MSAQAQIGQLQNEPDVPRWSLGLRIAFRFCFVYFGLYCICTQIVGGLISIPKMEAIDPSGLWPIKQVTFWTAAHIFHAKLPLVYSGSGSGDKTFDWVLTFCLLVFATLATGIWSALDRKRKNYVTLYKWFRLFIRFALASQLVGYGMAKLIPLQMPGLWLTRLLTPYGNFSPMGVLWSSIGAAPAYEMFAGSAEMLGGILLIIPCTATLGALVCVADMTQVFMLNMTYDVPVKLFSFHLLLMALFLLAPELQRLADFFFRNRTAALSNQPQLFKTRRANRIALAAQIVFGLWIIGTAAYGGWGDWHTYGGGRPKSPLYGIWNVDELSIDGQVRSPLLTDYDRWRRIIFDFPEVMVFQRMDDTFVGCSASINVKDNTLVLKKSSDKNFKGNFTFQRPAPDQLILDGEMGDHKTHMQLHLIDRSKFLLVNRGFHWIQEYPYNR